MKKFSFKPYLCFVVVAYYILAFTMMVTFFCYAAISEKLHEQIHKRNRTAICFRRTKWHCFLPIPEELNLPKMKDNMYMAEELKYLLISSILIALIIADIKIYSKMKGKKCWYTALLENIHCLILHKVNLPFYQIYMTQKGHQNINIKYPKRTNKKTQHFLTPPKALAANQ